MYISENVFKSNYESISLFILDKHKNSLNQHIKNMLSKKSNEEAEKSFRAQSQVNFVHTKQTDGDFIVYSTENKVAFFDLSKSPIKDKNLCNNLPFKCEGLCTTDSYLLVYGKYNCAISLKDNPFSDTFLEVKGFDGRIKKVETIDDEYFGVSTNIGLYISNKNENLTYRKA